jgi:hypothetical protein
MKIKHIIVEKEENLIFIPILLFAFLDFISSLGLCYLILNIEDVQPPLNKSFMIVHNLIYGFILLAFFTTNNFFANSLIKTKEVKHEITK